MDESSSRFCPIPSHMSVKLGKIYAAQALTALKNV